MPYPPGRSRPLDRARIGQPLPFAALPFDSRKDTVPCIPSTSMTCIRVLWLAVLQRPARRVGLEHEGGVLLQVGAAEGLVAATAAGVTHHHDADGLRAEGAIPPCGERHDPRCDGPPVEHQRERGPVSTLRDQLRERWQAVPAAAGPPLLPRLAGRGRAYNAASMRTREITCTVGGRSSSTVRPA